jgi:hydroxyacylglutathione hydrolase
MNLLTLPAFNDNYIWMLHDGRSALVVDPGDAAPVVAALTLHGLTLTDILVTHHHGDHVGGLAELLRHAPGAAVHGPAGEAMPVPVIPLREGDRFEALGVAWRVIDVPGHTAGHIAFFADRQPALPDAPLLFCGDTLFSGGCGRLFEGTPAQMLDSLTRLAALPGDTRVCCAHEYTLSNLRFARAVEPDNAELAAHEATCLALRAASQPTVPSRLGLERQINPFLRTHEASVIAAAQARGAAQDDPVAVFAAIRSWKNDHR